MNKRKNRKARTSGITQWDHQHWVVSENAPYLNRDLGWLEFNKRVLELVGDPSVPLLDRVKFLNIFHSNLDEFFMKRIGPVRRTVLLGLGDSKSKDGATFEKQFESMRLFVQNQFQEAHRLFHGHLRKELLENGIQLIEWKDLTPEEAVTCNQFFRSKVFPTLTPLAVDPGHPFPFISNLSLSIAVALKYPDGKEPLFARLKIPKFLPSWFQLPVVDGSPVRMVTTLDIIINNLDQLFPNMEVIGKMPFRVTRNIEIERREEDFENILEMMEEELKERRFEDVVKLEHGENPDPWILHFLVSELGLNERDIYEVSAMGLPSLEPVFQLNFPKLKYSPWVPVTRKSLLEEADLFHVIDQGDVLLHHPFESFTSSVERFIRMAADDPKVLAIKMTLYRTQEESPFIHSLIRAAESGKQVVCIIELKARLEEERNIYWANKLEEAGVHVVYGVVGLKTHCKLALVVRRETDGLRCYANIGTGNFNAQTAKLYTDLGLMTCQPEITEDVLEVFNYLTGRSLKKDYKKLLVAPIHMKNRFIELIRQEAENKKKGKPALIFVKCNNLEDHDICDALYEASKEGVEVRLIVRSICTLKPGIKNLSENIKVISVVDRFLEHSRLFYFQNGKENPSEGEFYIGSSDWMYRNLMGRVEVTTPIEKKELKESCWEILNVMWNDPCQAWEMKQDGTYTRRKWTGQTKPPSGQEILMQMTRETVRQQQGLTPSS